MGILTDCSMAHASNGFLSGTGSPILARVNGQLAVVGVLLVGGRADQDGTPYREVEGVVVSGAEAIAIDHAMIWRIKTVADVGDPPPPSRQAAELAAELLRSAFACSNEKPANYSPEPPRDGMVGIVWRTRLTERYTGDVSRFQGEKVYDGVTHNQIFNTIHRFKLTYTNTAEYRRIGRVDFSKDSKLVMLHCARGKDPCFVQALKRFPPADTLKNKDRLRVLKMEKEDATKDSRHPIEFCDAATAQRAARALEILIDYAKK